MRDRRPPQRDYAVVIKCCALACCTQWFIGEPKRRYCDEHRITQGNMVRGWSKPGGAKSRFSREEILEMRAMFYDHSAAEIAEHMGCDKSLVYKWQKRDPENYRE